MLRMGKNTFLVSWISKSYALQKEYAFNFWIIRLKPIFEAHGPNRYLRARKDLAPVRRKRFRDVILYIADKDHRISDGTGFVIRNR
jgi:hypothetical protein